MATTFTMARRGLPAFSDDPTLRLVMGTLLYLAQGFPQGVVFYAIPTWLAVHGQNTATVGAALAAATLPWSLKLVAGAAMDRYTWLPMGRRRPWLVGTQALILAAFLLFAIVSPPVTATTVVIGFAFTLSALTAMQDTALDALVIDLTPEGEQGRLNGFMLGGKSFGIAGGSAIAGNLLQHHGITMAMLAMAILFAIPAAASVLIRERPGEKLLPWTRGAAAPTAEATVPTAWWPIVRTALATLVNRDALLVVGLLVLYGIHQTLFDAASTLFAAHRLGWAEGTINNLLAINSIVSGIGLMVGGGPVIDRFGPKRVAFVSAAASFVLIGALAIAPGWWAASTPFVVWSFAAGATTGLFYLTFLVLAMRVCRPEIAATSFALIMAVSAGGGTAGGALLAPLEALGGIGAIFGAAAVLILVSGILPLFGSHHLGRIDDAIP